MILFLLRNPLDGLLGDGGQDVVGVPAFGHRSRTEGAAPRKGPGLDDGLGGNGDEAVTLDPTVGGEVDGSVPEVIIESLIEWTVRKMFCPVIGLGPGISFFGARFPDGIEVPTEMPLSKATRAVALFLEHFGDGEVLGLKDRSTKGPDDAVEAAPVVLSGQEREPARRADSGGTVPVGEGHAPGGQTIQVRGLYLRLGVAVGHVGHPHVVGVENDHVGSFGRLTGQGYCKEDGEDESIHCIW